MNTAQKLINAVGRMDAICLKPRLSAGISIHDRESGTRSGPKSITFSWTTTLLRAMVSLAVFFLIMKVFFCLCRMKRDRKMKKKLRAKWKRSHKK